MTIKMKTAAGYILSYDETTGMLTGETYPEKKWIKSYLEGKWDGIAKAWKIEANVLNFAQVRAAIARAAEMMPEATTETETVQPQVIEKTIHHKEFYNGNDGFYSVTYYTDGTSSKHFVG